MNFLKNLFGGGGPSGDGRSFYVYVRPKRCDQIIEVRIDLYNDLSLSEHNGGYFVRKVAQVVRCPFPAEMTLYFDKNRRYTHGDVENGELVSTETYEAWVKEQQTT